MTIGMAAAAGATTAMTIDFLRARLLSERSVSRAAKERADQLARRVAELEEQLRTVTAQRRKAERAAAEVLAILDSQGFGRLSDAADDSGSDDEVDDGGHDAAERDRGCGGIARWEAPEDALSGSELGSQEAAAAQAGGLSWKGRVANPDWERRRPHHQQQKGRQLRQRHGHSHRRGYLYMRSTDSSPKYHPGQSCRKVKRKELRSQTEGRDGKEDIAGESTEEGQERSDCTVCTDERHDFDGEVSQDGRSSSSNARVEDGGSQCAMDYGKEGEMERVLEKQAQLIGQYEAQENAQREWEKKFSESQDSTVNSLNNNRNQTKNACGTRETAQIMDKEVVCEQAISSENNLFGINDPSKYLLTDSVSELPSNAAEYSAIEQCKTDDNHDFGKTTGTVASSDSELPVRKDVLVIKRFLEIVEGSGYNLGKSSPTPQGSCDSSLNDGHNKGQGDENSDSGSSYHADARSSEHYINAPSVGSPLCGTPKSEVSEWSSSCFHNHTDNQLDTQLHQPSNDDVGGVIEALQRAKMSLREKLSRPSPHSQNILALPAPEDRYTKYDCPVNDTQLSLSRSTHLSQEIQALPAPGDYLNRRILPRDYVNVPVGPACLFRLPTDSFPRNEMASSDGYGSRFSLTATRRLHISSGYPGNHIVSTPSFSHYGSGFSSGTYYDPHSSMLLPMPTAGECSIPVSDFRIGGGSFPPEVPRPDNDFRR